MKELEMRLQDELSRNLSFMEGCDDVKSNDYKSYMSNTLTMYRALTSVENARIKLDNEAEKIRTEGINKDSEISKRYETDLAKIRSSEKIAADEIEIKTLTLEQSKYDTDARAKTEQARIAIDSTRIENDRALKERELEIRETEIDNERDLRERDMEGRAKIEYNKLKSAEDQAKLDRELKQKELESDRELRERDIEVRERTLSEERSLHERQLNLERLRLQREILRDKMDQEAAEDEAERSTLKTLGEFALDVGKMGLIGGMMLTVVKAETEGAITTKILPYLLKPFTFIK